MKRIIATIILALVVCGPALGADMHWCEKANGVGGNYPICPAGYAQKDGEKYVAPTPPDKRTTLSEYDDYCFSSGHTGMECQLRQASANDSMKALYKSLSTTDEQKEVIAQCFLKWYKKTMNVVDAEMWKYCYAHY